MKIRLNYLPLFLLMSTFSISAYSADNCLTIIKDMLGSFDQELAKTINLDAHIDHRNFIANYAKKNNIPVFTKQNSSGEDVPFILVNRTSSKKLKNFIENSYGTEVALQPGYNNDHGLMRTGNYVIDVDAPGYRGYGEIHKTGLAWKDFSAYTARRTAESGVILEVSYLVTPEEKKIIDFYQRIRRAAIFRVKFAFKDFKTEDHPFLLNSGGEHCFIFCKAQAVTSHIGELQNKLASFGVTNVDAYVNNKDIQAGINQLKEHILATGPMDLKPEILSTKSSLAVFNNLYPKEVTTDVQKYEFVRWLLSYDGSKNYNRVLKDLGITSDYGVGDARNKRVSAVLVYDEGADAEKFLKGDYKANGAFTPWPNGTQKPVE